MPTKKTRLYGGSKPLKPRSRNQKRLSAQSLTAKRGEQNHNLFGKECSDRKEYLVKGMQAGRQVVNDHIVANGQPYFAAHGISFEVHVRHTVFQLGYKECTTAL